MGYKIRTLEVQIFVRCKRSKWGTVPPNGVRLATLTQHHVRVLIVSIRCTTCVTLNSLVLDAEFHSLSNGTGLNRVYRQTKKISLSTMILSFILHKIVVHNSN